MDNIEAYKILQKELGTMIKNNELLDKIEAMKIALSVLNNVEQYKIERDVAIEQLNKTIHKLSKSITNKNNSLNESKC